MGVLHSVGQPASGINGGAKYSHTWIKAGTQGMFKAFKISENFCCTRQQMNYKLTQPRMNKDYKLY